MLFPPLLKSLPIPVGLCYMVTYDIQVISRIMLTISIRKNSIAIKSITIDGDGSDWNDIRPILMDKKRDVSNNKTNMDITKVYLPMDSKYLYVRTDFVKGLPVTNKDDYTRECLI